MHTFRLFSVDSALRSSLIVLYMHILTHVYRHTCTPPHTHTHTHTHNTAMHAYYTHLEASKCGQCCEVVIDGVKHCSVVERVCAASRKLTAVCR